MSETYIAHLADRGTVAVTGADAAKFLNGLATNELAQLAQGESAHAGLLSPQGKILFDFIAVRTAEGFLLDVARDTAAGLVKRLSIYKLRAAVLIEDVSASFVTYALWGAAPHSSGQTQGTVSFSDPRHAALGLRILAEHAFAADVASATNGFDEAAPAYHAHRINLGVPEGGKDYEFGDAYPHEADFDLFNGVSFKKGCYVGQEVISRMQHKTVVRKRVVRIEGENDLTEGADVTHRDVVFGRVGSAAGNFGLSLLRLDRYADAVQAGDAVMAGGVRITVNPQDTGRYLASLSARQTT